MSSQKVLGLQKKNDSKHACSLCILMCGYIDTIVAKDPIDAVEIELIMKVSQADRREISTVTEETSLLSLCT